MESLEVSAPRTSEMPELLCRFSYDEEKSMFTQNFRKHFSCAHLGRYLNDYKKSEVALVRHLPDSRHCRCKGPEVGERGCFS